MDLGALAALIISLCAVLATVVGLRRSNRAVEKSQYVDDLEGRVELLETDNKDLKDQLKECRRGREELQTQHFNLLMEFHQLQRTHSRLKGE